MIESKSMTKEHRKFQSSVLRFYDFYIEFVGDIPKHVERPIPGKSKESFAVWKKRVLGSDVSDVCVYRPVIVDGRTRLSTLAVEGRALKQLIQQSRAEVKAIGKESLQVVEDNATRQKQEIKNKARKVLKEVKNQAATEIEKTRETLLQKAMLVPIEELEYIIGQNGEVLEPAVKEHLENLMANAKMDKFPLEALLRGLIETQIQAVRIVRNANNV